MNSLDLPPTIIPLDSIHMEPPIEYVRDEIIDFLKDQIAALPEDILKGCLQGLNVCEMFVTPSEFQDELEARKRYEFFIFSKKMEKDDVAIMIDHANATWMIQCVYDVLCEYWQINKSTNVIALLILAKIQQRYLSD